MNRETERETGRDRVPWSPAKLLGLDIAFLLPILFLSVTLPSMALRRSLDSGVIVGEVNFSFALMVYAAIGFSTIVSLGLLWPREKITDFQDYPIFIFTFFIVMQSLILQSAVIALNSALFIVIAASFRVLSYSRSFHSTLAFSSLALVIFIGLAFLLLGPPVERWLGGIHPNILGSSLVAALSLSLFGSRIWRDLVLVIVIVSGVVVSSRYAIVACLLIYLVFGFFNLRTLGVFRLLAVSAAGLAASVNYIANPFDGLVSQALLIYDSSRGLGTGLTGRDYHWSMFLPQFMEHPIIGYGFRDKLAYFSPHNGFLDLFLQVGTVGAVFFLSFFLFRLVALFREALSAPANRDRGHFLSIIIGLSFAAQFQPQLINFGDPFGILVLLCLFAKRL